MKKTLILLTGLFILNSLLVSCKSTFKQTSQNDYTQTLNAVEKSIQNTKLPLTGEKTFTGIIGNSIIVQMTLTFNDNKVSGICSYYTSNDTNFNVTGEIENNKIKLYQTDTSGSSLGCLEGTIINNSRIIGTWVNPDATKTLSFEIQEDKSDENNQNLKGTWKGINNEGELKITSDNKNNINFTISANSQNGIHNLCGTLEFTDGVGIYKDDNNNYTLYLVAVDDYIVITTCSEKENYTGPEAIFDGKYIKISS